jgi:hypothetical protein
MPVRRGIGQRKDAGAQASRAKRVVDVNVPDCRTAGQLQVDALNAADG